MDGTRFDALTRHLSSRRTALGGLLAGLLLPLETSGRGKRGKHRKRKGQSKDRNTGKGKGKTLKRTRAQAEVCWRTGACIPKKGANVSQCDLAGYTAPIGLNCTGCNISRANLRDANLSGVNFTKANLSGACLVNANFTGATFTNTTNLYNAIFCNTTMPDGSINNSGCGSGTVCCPIPCTAASCSQTCCSELCVNLQSDSNNCGTCGNECGTGTICQGGGCVCAPATCQSLGKACGSWPDGCGDTLQCGSCSSTQLCDEGTCQACNVCASGCAHSTVPAAIAAASAGATIRICPGTYTRLFSTNSVAFIQKNLTLIGAGIGVTIFDGGGNPSTNPVLRVDGPASAEVRDLTVTGGATFGGIHVRPIPALPSLTLTRVLVTGNSATTLPGGGIAILGGTLTLNAGTSVTGNTATSVGGIHNAGTLILNPGSVVSGNTPSPQCQNVGAGTGCP